MLLSISSSLDGAIENFVDSLSFSPGLAVGRQTGRRPRDDQPHRPPALATARLWDHGPSTPQDPRCDPADTSCGPQTEVKETNSESSEVTAADVGSEHGNLGE